MECVEAKRPGLQYKHQSLLLFCGRLPLTIYLFLYVEGERKQVLYRAERVIPERQLIYAHNQGCLSRVKAARSCRFVQLVAGRRAPTHHHSLWMIHTLK